MLTSDSTYVRFHFTDTNWRELIRLADKYRIDALHKDIEGYTYKLIHERIQPTLSLCLFSARYSLVGLYNYCFSNPMVFQLVKEALCDEETGIASLSDQGIPLQALSRVVRDVISRLDYVDQQDPKNWECLGHDCCGEVYEGRMCHTCRAKYSH